MRAIGFSTGALAKGDFRRALELLRPDRENGPGESRAVELSALREPELAPLLASLPELEGGGALHGYDHVSLHAPSAMDPSREPAHAAAIARALGPRGVPCVVHPDAIETPLAWEPLGALLLIENMDGRKPTGRTAAELTAAFETFPEARLCFDIAHARHVDPSLDEARRILDAHGHRLAQLHLSGLTRSAAHRPLDEGMLAAARALAPRIPPRTPVILESTIEPERDAIRAEITKARRALAGVEAGAGRRGDGGGRPG
ncbi:MAG: hypothetical protein PVG07_06910 [Acidobacteriota bacterium]